MSFLSNSNVVTDKGLVPIKDIQPGCRILSDKGCFKEVIALNISKYSGNILKIKTRHFNEEFIVTEGHKFYGCRANKCKSTQVFCKPECKHQYKHRNGKTTPNCKKGYQDYKFDYVPINNFGVGDILTSPMFQETHEKEIDLYIDPKHDRLKRLPRNVLVTPELMRFFGYYLAEGCKGQDRIVFSFNSDEKEYVNDSLYLCKKYFNLKGKTYYFKYKKSVNVSFHSKCFAQFIDSIFGHYAKYKKIPEWCLYLKEKYLIEFFKGWAYGDGGFKDDCFAITTICSDLSFKMRLILMKMGINIYINYWKTKKDNKVYYAIITGIQLNILKGKTELVHYNKNRGVNLNKYFYLENQYAHYPIRSIEKEHYEGVVYDLKIEENAPYTVNYALCV
jgi:hypothetical protein